MKKFYLAAVIVVFLLLCTKGIQSQTTKSQLNKVELMKKFLGYW